MYAWVLILFMQMPPLGATVTKIVDGDTLTVTLDGTEDKLTVRLIGVDCPESRKNQKCAREGKADKRFDCAAQKPKGVIAKKEVEALLQDKKITLECENKCKTDLYKRALRYAFLEDGTDIGLALIQRGLCYSFRKYPHRKKQDYNTAEDKAKQDKLGVWQK